MKTTRAIAFILKAALKNSGKSGSEIARSFGISRQAAWSLMNEKKPQNYTIEMLERLAPLIGLRLVVEFRVVEIGATEIKK